MFHGNESGNDISQWWGQQHSWGMSWLMVSQYITNTHSLITHNTQTTFPAESSDASYHGASGKVNHENFISRWDKNYFRESSLFLNFQKDLCRISPERNCVMVVLLEVDEFVLPWNIDKIVCWLVQESVMPGGVRGPGNNVTLYCAPEPCWPMTLAPIYNIPTSAIHIDLSSVSGYYSHQYF